MDDTTNALFSFIKQTFEANGITTIVISDEILINHPTKMANYVKIMMYDSKIVINCWKFTRRLNKTYDITQKNSIQEAIELIKAHLNSEIEDRLFQ